MSVEILLQSLISTCAALHFDTKYKPIFFLINSGCEKEDLKRLNYSVFLSKQNKQHIRTIGHLPTYLSVWEGNINNSTFGKGFTAVDTATYP